MGYYGDLQYEKIMGGALEGPLVAATPGFFRLDDRHPDEAPEPVLAWRVGPAIVLPVTRFGCDDHEYYVLYPDGTVKRHFPSVGAALPDFRSLAEWRAQVSESD